MTRALLILGLLAAALPAFASELKGFWKGTATLDGETTLIEFRFQESGDGLIGNVSLPEYARLRIPFVSIEENGRNVSLNVRAVNYKFAMQASLLGDELSGTWEWPRVDRKAEFSVTRATEDLPYTEEVVRFANEQDGVEIAGTLLTPKSNGPHPGIVLIHGSGYNERWWVWYMADLFAKNGIAALAIDKRGCGESGGEWESVSLETLAMDGVAGVHLLQSRDDIVATRVGLWGISQAGWIMPIAAVNSSDIAFIVVTSGAAVTVEEEGYFDYIVQLKDAGYSEEDRAKARDILERDFQVSVTGEGYDELMAKVSEVRDEAWYKELRIFVSPPDSNARRFYRINGIFDPVPYWEQIKIPVLFLYGEEDRSVEPSRSIEILNRIIAEQEPDFTIRSFPRADHGIRVPVDSKFPYTRPAPGYFDTMIDWLNNGPLAADRTP